MCFPAAILIAACTLAAGCTSLTSRSRDRDRDRPASREREKDRDGNTDRPWWMDGAEAGSRGKGRAADLARTDREGIIAGVIVDAGDGRALKGITFVRVRAAEEVEPASGKGLGFETDAEGYFFVPGLTPGKTYILSVVREVDGRKIAGEAQVRPPAGNLRLELGENKVSSVTPPLPPPPGSGPFERNNSATIKAPIPADPPAGADRGGEPGGTTPLVEPPPSLRKENIASNPIVTPPTAAIRPPPPAAIPGAAPRPPEKPAEDPPAARLPSQRVPNFVLSDVTQSEWEFQYASGRLVLMEFWSTTCVPCARAVPAIKRLQADYGTGGGLEIVAVACEADAPLTARARAVEEIARRKELTYKVYLERDGKVGEIQKLFNVQWVPTLVLLDRQGTVLWRGGATDADLARVDEIIKGYLTKR